MQAFPCLHLMVGTRWFRFALLFYARFIEEKRKRGEISLIQAFFAKLQSIRASRVFRKQIRGPDGKLLLLRRQFR